MIERENSALTVLNPTGFVFFLPAYMSWTIRNHKISDSTTVDNTVYSLDVTQSGFETKSTKLERFEYLSLTQKKATLGFLKYMTTASYSDNDAAVNAVNSYWVRFA